MFGHGRPNFQRSLQGTLQRQTNPYLRDRCALGVVVFLSIVFLASSDLPGQDRPGLQPAQVANEATPSDLRLRFAWGGGVPRLWKGTISINNGAFVGHRILAISSDAPSTVIKRGKDLVIDHRIATSYGGVDASVSLEENATIELKLSSETGETFERTWTVESLHGGINEAIDQHENRLTIARAPGDQVRINIGRPHLVFRPGERWQFQTWLQRTEFRGQLLSTRLSWKQDDKIVPIPNALPELSSDESGSTQAELVNITVPEKEGAYDLWIEASPTSKSPFGQFSRPKQITRRIQIMVVSEDAPYVELGNDWSILQSFTPQEMRGSFTSSWPRFPGSKDIDRRGQLSLVKINDDRETDALVFASKAAITIPVPQVAGSGTALPIRVSLRYRNVSGTQLTINYLSASQQVMYGMDSGISVPAPTTGVSADNQWQTYTFHIWPEDDPGYIRVANISNQTLARIGELKFETGPSRLPAAQIQVESSDHMHRQRMAFLESPDFGGLFQSQRKIDPETGQQLDDWNTFYASVDRLTQYLKANHYDGAFVTIASDGSALCPSFGLAPGSRFDTGIFSSGGCDPVQKDVVELMMRMFDRENLKIVPVLALNSTLEPLESLREAELMSFDLVDHEGQTANFKQSRLPIYNPLDRTLQGVCSRGVASLAERYGQHRSFSGLALNCGPTSCTLLPGTKHGFDNITLQRFAQAHNVGLNELDLNCLLADDPTNAIHEAWLSWRNSEMSSWYRDMAATLSQDSSRPLYILPVDIFRKNELVAALSPSLRRSEDYGRVMRKVGLDAENATDNNVVVLASGIVAPGRTLARKRVDLNVRQSQTADQFTREKTGGSIFVHRGDWSRIQTGISRNGVKDVTRMRILSPSAAAVKRNYIESLRRSDCTLFVDGGNTLPRGIAEIIEPIATVVRQLPAIRFEDIGDPSRGPVCMRQLSVDGQHYFYAINDSPWPIEVTAWLDQRKVPQVLQASANTNGKASPLKTFDTTEVLLEQKNGRTVIRVLLDPWSIYAATARTNSAFNPYAIERFDVLVPEQVDSSLRKKLHQLKNKLAKAKSAKPISQLLNGSFETFVDPTKSGWEFGNHPEATFELDSSEFREGRVSLSMKTSGQPVWIRSNNLSMPETGRLTVSAWFRTENPKQQPQVRVSIEGTSDGRNLYRFRTVGGAKNENGTTPLSSNWQRIVVHFDDLPFDTANPRIGFDLMSPGQVSVDQVEVFDRWLDENDSVAMTQLLASAGSQLKNRQSIDSGRRVLESYWVQFLDQYIGKGSQQKATDNSEHNQFGIPLPSFEIPSFELPKLTPKKAKRTPLFQRFQRRE